MAGLLSFAVLQIGLGAFMGFAPHAFFETVGPWGAANDHYVRDMATCYAAAGIVMAMALRRPSWRAPAFALATIQFALHSANHLLDIGRAHPRWVGYVDFAALLAATIQLALLWRACDRDARYAATGADGRIPTPSSSPLPLAPAPERRST
jgi:hypothetical protein